MLLVLARAPCVLSGCFSDPNQVYTFGENVSFNLGHKNATKRLLPEPVDYFARLSISIKKVCQMVAI